MNRLVIILIVGALVIGGIIWFVATRDKGLPEADVTKAKAELEKFDRAKADLAGYAKAVAASLKAHPGLFKAYAGSADWAEQAKKYLADLTEASGLRDELAGLLEANRSKDRSKVDELRLGLSKTRADVMPRATRIHQIAARAVAFVKDLRKSVGTMKGDAEHVAALDLTGIEAKAAAAGKAWPAKRDDLSRRVARLKNAKTGAGESWQAVAATAQKAYSQKITEAETGELAQAAQTIHDDRLLLDKGAAELPGLIAQLYWSLDRILVDMDIKEGEEVTFHLKIKTVRTPVVPEGRNVVPKQSEAWTQVSKSEYEKRKGQLGLALEQKPAGKYDFETVRTAQPPGYRYVADPSVGRNHYGRWRHYGGHYGWYWYPHYGYMGGMYWGSRYGRIYRSDYGAYASANRGGRTYLGPTRGGRSSFGSSGTATRSRYSSSKYVRTGGLKNTNYVRSGGTYRGSKYSSRGSYRSSSRSGSRSGGGK